MSATIIDPAALPCVGNAALYDVVFFDEEAPAVERAQAVHRAAALCAVCPRPCEQKVTTDSGPRELVLLEPDWMPPAREGNPEPDREEKPEPERPAASRKRPSRQTVPALGQDYVPTGKRAETWAGMAAYRAALGYRLSDIAVELCVDESTAAALVELGRKRPGIAA